MRLTKERMEFSNQRLEASRLRNSPKSFLRHSCPFSARGEFRGESGVGDTRRALVGSVRSGTHPFCITIDRQAR